MRSLRLLLSLRSLRFRPRSRLAKSYILGLILVAVVLSISSAKSTLFVAANLGTPVPKLGDGRARSDGDVSPKLTVQNNLRKLKSHGDTRYTSQPPSSTPFFHPSPHLTGFGLAVTSLSTSHD